MHRPQKLLQQILLDAAARCSISVQSRDLQTIEDRVKHEGLSFLTITLPDYLQSFMEALESGQVTSSHFVGWKKRQCLPAFLQGFTKLVFDCTSGRVYDEPNVSAIQSIRQICSTFKKVKLNCTPERVNNALEEYCCLDDEMEKLVDSISDDSLSDFELVSSILWCEVFQDFDTENLVPVHGPGSTAEKVTGNQKYNPVNYSWPTRLDHAFNAGYTLYSSEECMYNANEPYTTRDFSNELPVRVVSVPKTLKKPRIIALEPVAMQMAQQAVKNFVVDLLERHPITRGHINFTDQEINQQLALESSITKSMATLDLSAASDRVHKDLVSLMLSSNQKLHDLCFITRSRTAQVSFTDGSQRILNLNKYASMGSALCFPVEAMFFTVCTVLGMLRGKQLPLNLHNITTVMKDVYVYGDDIIVPADMVEDVVATLAEFGNVVGLKKSFWKGSFRESCGMDAYAGIDITPVYVRHMMPTSRKNVSAVISTTETANLMYKRGWTRTAIYLKDQVEKVIGKLPYVSENCSGIGWHFNTFGENRTRWNARLQRFEVLTFVPKVVKKKDHIMGYHALTKCLIKLERSFPSISSKEPHWRRQRAIFDVAMYQDEGHLVSSARFGALTLKRRWTTH